jgi:aromatic-L-amino-acid decarboxylase
MASAMTTPRKSLADPAPPTPPTPVDDLNWSPSRASALGTHAVALWKELLEKLPSIPVSRRWRDVDIARSLDLSIPSAPLTEGELLARLRSVMFDHSMYPGHPRFMAFISGAGTVPGAVADFLAAALNQNVGGWRLAPAATEIELSLTRFFANVMGLPLGAGGLMVSGGAMANFVALKAARDAKAGWNVRADGLRAGPPLAIYASREVHDVVDRGADMLGLGAAAVRKIPVDAELRMDISALRARIAHDVAQGVRPIAVVGSAGTVATGAIDPLAEIADVCAEHGLWFHVDGAYGALAMLAPELRPSFAGIERADSIAFDPHKWLYTPHSGGCVVVRDMKHLSDAFAIHPAYVREDKEHTGHGVDFHTLGPQFSRGFQAFKVWLSLLAHGRDAYARRIAHDVHLARYMAARAAERPDLEVMAKVTLSICCFRYVPLSMASPESVSVVREAYLDRLNERLMAEIQLDGRAFCSNAVLGDRYVLRACIVNFRTEAADVDALLDVACELGEKLDREMRVTPS